MRPLAESYSRIVVAHSTRIGDIDGYQLVLYTVLLALLCGVAFLTNPRARPNASRLIPPWLYCLLLVLALFLVRLPTFLAGELNVDESMFLAGAAKLRHYPVFWRSVNGGTSGPLNFYALTVLNILGFPLDYATAHFMNMICAGGAIAVVYRIARLFIDDWIARLMPLPLLAAAMGFRSPDFLHYSSECVPLFLIAAATWLLMVDITQQPNRLREIGIGVLVVLIPLAKLQAGPMAAVLAIAGVAHVFLRRPESSWRRSVSIAAGFAGGVILFLSLLVLLGAFPAFERSYLAANLIYANQSPPPSSKDLLVYVLNNGDLKWYEGGILGFLLCAVCASCYVRTRGDGRTWIQRLGNRFSFHDFVALLLLAASVYAVYRPHILLRHYLMFLIFPVSLMGVRAMAHLLRDASAEAGHSRKQIVWTVLVFVFGALVLPGLARGRDTILAFNSEAWMTAEEGGFACAPCQVISYFAKSGDPITLWGWVPKLFVLTHTLPATRDVVTYWQMKPGLLRGSFQQSFLEDLQELPPQLFVDAVGPGEFGYQDRKRYGYETFPELRDYVNSNFYLAGDIDGVRIFARNGTNRQVSLPFRMKCAGGPVSDEAGSGWKADAYFSDGQSRQFQPGVAIGKLPPLYASERVCAKECRYLIPIQNGTYLVRMFFAERDYTAANQRLFDVAVDDDALGVDVDIFRAAGGAGKPYVVELPTTVSNGLLDVTLIPKLREAEINAIEILPRPETKSPVFQVQSIEAGQADPAAEGMAWDAGPGWVRGRAKHGSASSLTWRNDGDPGTLKGLLTSGPLPWSSTGCVVVSVGYGSSVSERSVGLFDVRTGERIGAIPLKPGQEGWQSYEIRYDPSKTVRLVAANQGRDWLGVRGPRACR
ncbi:MAG TPA: malectin domain-containing carbohydrate-binding protein [Bryobacteraceae bacterium]|nr:malectin domain-containing carbohydrate-binding protein [Bryobacteraceae bacterium]